MSPKNDTLPSTADLAPAPDSASVASPVAVADALKTHTASMIHEAVRQPKRITIGTLDLARELGLTEQPVKLPNGREVMSITWSPSDLPRAFELLSTKRAELGLGNRDLVVFDGPAPIWLLATLSHAVHPVSTAMRYPQGGPDATLPLSGALITEKGHAPDVTFTITDRDQDVLVEYALSQPQVDAVALMAQLEAPAIPLGKPVKLSGRGPAAIMVSLAEAYAHTVPSVACFQPGTGYVTSISHDDARPMGTVEMT